MTLVSLSLVGKDNEPLYVRDFFTHTNPKTGVEGNEIEDDLFGIFCGSEAERDGDAAVSFTNPFRCSLRQQFILHSALDRFEELTGPSSGNRWRTPGATGSDAMWVGLLCPVEELRVYGHLTNTNVKLLGVIEDTFVSGQQQQQTREAELKTLFANIHHLYVDYTLNPFTKLQSRIVSKRFDEGVKAYVHAFNSQNT